MCYEYLLKSPLQKSNGKKSEGKRNDNCNSNWLNKVVLVMAVNNIHSSGRFRKG
jgi:hypothetical protein